MTVKENKGGFFSSIPKMKFEENALYFIIWLVIGITFAALGSFGALLPYLTLFLLHNYLIFPLLFRKDRKLWYIVTMIVVMVVFSAWEIHEMRAHHGPGPGMNGEGAGAPMEMTSSDPSGMGRPRPQMGPGARPDVFRFLQADSADMSGEGMVPPPPGGEGGPGRERWDEYPAPPQMGEHPNDAPPSPIGPILMRIITGILLVLTNVGFKMFFHSRESEQRMIALEKENLDQQLQYLRYQINPHFFMNTLNNIHALVDIDPEQAKSSILELSRMMRYILYEGNKPTIPLTKETEFLRHYIYLMRLRYADTVKIDVDLPSECGNCEIPPLIFVSFVENAFKHGISYEDESFIKVSMALENEKLIFKCVNSRHGTNSDQYSGIGQTNVRKRLDLLYGKNYTLHIDEGEKEYDILVVIPVTRPADQEETVKEPEKQNV